MSKNLKFLYREDICLLELTPALLSEFLSNPVVLRGNPTDKAKILTPSHTFYLKNQVTSNTILLVENENIISSLSTVYEPQICIPSLSLLFSSLCEYPNECCSRGLSLEKISSLVQASNEEIKRALTEMRAIKINGRYFKLNIEKKMEIMELIILSLRENGIYFGEAKLSSKDVAGLVDDDDERWSEYKSLIMCIWIMLSEEYKSEGISLMDNENTCNLTFSISTAIKWVAQSILEKKHSYEVNEFLLLWKNLLNKLTADDGVGGLCDLDLLVGMAIVYDEEERKVISFFPVDFYGTDPSKVFERLFSVRKIWKFEDILVYINHLTDSVQNLLTKYCRCEVNSNGKFYSKR
jgi:hypothetical protein